MLKVVHQEHNSVLIGTYGYNHTRVGGGGRLEALLTAPSPSQ